MDRWIRWLTAFVVLTVAGVAATVSFTHLYNLALEHGQDGLAARLTPVSIDATILAGSLALLDAARRSLPAPHLGRVLLGAGIAATIAGNLYYGLRFGFVGGLISGWPAAALVGCMELIAGMIRTAQRSKEIQAGPEDGPAPAVYRIFADQIAKKEVPSIRQIKQALQCSQDRAVRVQKYLEFVIES